MKKAFLISLDWQNFSIIVGTMKDTWWVMESVEEEFERYLNLTDEFKVNNEKVSR